MTVTRTAPGTPQPVPPSPTPSIESARRYVPWIVASALFMEQLDATIVNTRIPASGWVANRFGTRRVFLRAIVMFTLACGSLVAGYFLSHGATHDAAATVHALHLAFVVMAVLTLCSAWIFRTLDPHDGDSVSRPEAGSEGGAVGEGPDGRSAHAALAKH